MVGETDSRVPLRKAEKLQLFFFPFRSLKDSEGHYPKAADSPVCQSPISLAKLGKSSTPRSIPFRPWWSFRDGLLRSFDRFLPEEFQRPNDPSLELGTHWNESKTLSKENSNEKKEEARITYAIGLRSGIGRNMSVRRDGRRNAFPSHGASGGISSVFDGYVKRGHVQAFVGLFVQKGFLVGRYGVSDVTRNCVGRTRRPSVQLMIILVVFFEILRLQTGRQLHFHVLHFPTLKPAPVKSNPNRLLSGDKTK